MLWKAGFLMAVPEDGAVTVTTAMPDTVSLGLAAPPPMPSLPAEDSPPVRTTPVPVEAPYPDAQAALMREGVLRGVPVARANVIPYSWDPATGELLHFPAVEARFEFGGGLDLSEGGGGPFFGRLLRSRLVNGRVLPEAVFPDPGAGTGADGPVLVEDPSDLQEVDGADLMIICGNGLLESVDDLAEMRHRQGYLTVVVDGFGLDAHQIAAMIGEAYDTWDPAPSYVLLVGDSQLLPTTYADSTGVWTDNRYCCVDGDDFIADIFCGRLPVVAGEAGWAEGKILAWETAPPDDAGFWNRVLLATTFQDADANNVEDIWFCFTSEVLARTLSDSLGKSVLREYIRTGQASPDTLWYRPDPPATGEPVPQWMPWEGSAEGISAAFNQGVFLVQHRAHGYTGTWGGPFWGLGNLPDLDNAGRTPVVLSINCHTGNFREECLAEGLIAMDGGAVSAIAATGSSYSYWNDYLCYGMYMGFLGACDSPPVTYTTQAGAHSAGQALLAGKLEMQASAPGCPWPEDKTAEQWDLYHVLGDPITDMRTGVPATILVDAPDSLQAGDSQAVFGVHTTFGAPVPGALVCLRKPDQGIYSRAYTDSLGYALLGFEPVEEPTEMPWYVSGHNLRPQEGVVNGTGTFCPPSPARASMSLFPVPCRGRVTLEAGLPEAAELRASVYDVSGRVVLRAFSAEPSSLHRLQIDVGGLPPGVYAVRAAAGGRVMSSRMVVIN
ncbi:MAG: C25 family cysteine peptidase [Candidatus Fermentibacterota bacterium]